MHADQLHLEEPLDTVAKRQAPAGYDPYAFASWAEARAKYPANSLICIVDVGEAKHFVTPLPPLNDWSDLCQDGRTYVIEAPGFEGSAEDIEKFLRFFNPGPFVRQSPPRR